MPNKNQVMSSIGKDTNKPTYSKKEVLGILNTVSYGATKPSRLKKGDVYISPVGVKHRPVVICKVVGDIVLGVPLSTTEDCLTLCDSKSRFFGDHFFAKQVVTAPYTHAMDNFAGVFDNNTSLNKAIKMMKSFYLENL